MKRIAPTRTPGIFLRATCAAVLAGTCLLAPALAQAAPASAAADSAKAASAKVDATAQSVAFGGIELAVPADWVQVQLGFDMLVTASPDGLMSASVIPAEADDVPAADSADFKTYFGEAAEAAADSVGGTLKGSDAVELTDGTKAWACVIDATQTSDASMLYVVYVPTKTGVTCLMISADASAKNGEDVADAIAQSAVTSTATAVAPAPAARLGETGAGGGITLSLPEGLVAEDDDPDAPSWINADGTFMVGIIPDMTEGAGTLTDEEVDACAQLAASMMGGSLLGSMKVEAEGVTVSLFAFTFVADGEVLLGAVGLVPVADGSVTAVMAVCTGADAEAYGADMDQMFASIALA